MNKEELELLVARELQQIAPEIELADIDRDEDLREEFDLDSMDFLNLIAAIGKRLNVVIPEADYGLMSTFNGFSEYLHKRL